MLKSVRRNLLLTLAVAAVIISQMMGCSEEEVYTVSQEEELERYIADSDFGQDLFGPIQIAGSWTYTFPGVDTVFTDFIDSTRHYVSVYTNSDSLIDLGIGEYYFGIATVFDDIYGRTRKEVSGSSFETYFKRTVRREGFLVKLGDNSQPFSGWLLCGFNGGPTINLFDITADGLRLDNRYINGVTIGTVTLPSSDFPYKDIEEIISVDKGVELVLDGCPDCVILANHESATGFETENMTTGLTGSMCFNDTLLTSATTDRLFSYLYVTAICKVDSNFTSVNHAVLPYKLNQ